MSEQVPHLTRQDPAEELATIQTLVDTLSAMPDEGRQRALNYIIDRYRDPGSYTDIDVDELADVLVDAGRAGVTLGGGGTSLARVVLDAGYRQIAIAHPSREG